MKDGAEERIYIIGLSLCPSAHMFIIFSLLPPKPQTCLSDEHVKCNKISWQFSFH